MVKKFFNAIKSLGAFGIILLICVIIIIGSTLAFLNVWNNTIYNETIKLTILEDTANYYVVNQMIEENYFVYSEGEYAEESVALFNEARDEVNTALEELQAQETHSLSDREIAFVEEISAAQQEYEQTFSDIVDTITTPGWTWDEVMELQAVADEQANVLRSTLQGLIAEIEAARQEAAQALETNLQSAIRSGVISLMLLPFLAIWAFALASRITQPVLTLTHAATAVAGDHFRPEVLDEILDRRDGLGQLAHAMEHLADTSKARESALEAEIADLREQLHETRRRKFKPTFPTHDAESA
jgi:nitrate/nitrite-specific signal transduction histidine kinase